MAFLRGAPVTTEKRGAKHSRNTIIPERRREGSRGRCRVCTRVSVLQECESQRAYVCPCQSTRRFFGILIAVVHRPPIVSYDLLSRHLPKELNLPIPPIIANKKLHEENVSYLSGSPCEEKKRY